MKVEREIAGFSLPFAAGTAFAAYSEVSSYSLSQAFAAPSMLLSIALAILLLFISGKDRRPTLTSVIMGSTGLMLGLFCGLTANIMEIHSGMGVISMKAEGIGRMMQSACDSIPFCSEGTNAIVKALLTGDRSDISDSITESFRKSGASHILALSGLHLGIIYMLAVRCLSIMGNGRNTSIARSVATVMACGIYTLATGAGPSITRALLFIFLNETAKLSGRHSSTSSVLMSSLLIQLCITPQAISSVGFQLSYAAMAGIAFIYPWMRNFWPGKERDGFFRNPVRWIWDSAALSISCQLATGPLVYLYFGSIPKHFIMTNLAALPLTGLLIPSAVATVILNHTGICPDILIRITEKLADLLTGCLETIACM